jgi:hypothetical protein
VLAVFDSLQASGLTGTAPCINSKPPVNSKELDLCRLAIRCQVEHGSSLPPESTTSLLSRPNQSLPSETIPERTKLTAGARRANDALTAPDGQRFPLRARVLTPQVKTDRLVARLSQSSTSHTSVASEMPTDFGRFFDRQASEVPKFDDERVEGSHPLQQFVQREDVNPARTVGCRLVTVQCDAFEPAPALVGETRSRVIDENPPHQAGSHAKEIRPVVPLDVTLVDQSDVGFVHEGSWVQRMAGRFAPHLCSCDSAQVVHTSGTSWSSASRPPR